MNAGWHPSARHLLYIVDALVLAVVAGIGFVLASIWLEAKFPASESDPHSWMMQTRDITTKPVVQTVGVHVGKYTRSRLFSAWIQMQIPERETIERYLSPSTPEGERQMLAYRLARLGTSDSIAALVRGFETAPPERKALLAQLLGMTGRPEMKPLLLPLLESADQSIVVAAVEGLSALGGEDVVQRVGEMLGDTGRDQAVRVAAAHALAETASPSAREALVKVLDFNPESGLTRETLRSLGHWPFAEVADVFQSYLTALDVPSDLRAVAVEALAFSSKEAVPFLLREAAYDADPEVRASAAWAISAQPVDFSIGSTLATLLEREADPDVRLRLFEAIAPQPTVPTDRLWLSAIAETEIPVRIAASNAVATAVGRTPGSDLAARFDRVLVPELERVASHENTMNLRLRAVFALRQAETPAAQSALARVATTSSTTVAEAARAGLHALTANKP